MPFMNIKIAGNLLSAEQISALQTKSTDLLANVLHKQPGLAAVLVENVPMSFWSIGHLPARTAAHVDVKVTAGTNTAEEKAQFIGEAMQMLRDILGSSINPVAYIVIDEIPADAWGYDGRTQLSRRQEVEGSNIWPKSQEITSG